MMEIGTVHSRAGRRRWEWGNGGGGGGYMGYMSRNPGELGLFYLDLYVGYIIRHWNIHWSVFICDLFTLQYARLASIKIQRINEEN